MLVVSRMTAAAEMPARNVAAAPSFEAVYDEHFPFVWRSARRLGVSLSAVDDVVQEIFLVVHRRLPEFEGRASVRTWLFAIALRVVRDHRRSLRRKGRHLAVEAEVDQLPGASDAGPLEQAAKAEAVKVLHELLDALDDEKREVFVLAELEQLPVPEIAEALEVNPNTVYSRLRAARQAFEEALARHHARDRWRVR
jgi:RNA polymerase sigma-70 factor (ECF subfamily)